MNAPVTGAAATDEAVAAAFAALLADLAPHRDALAERAVDARPFPARAGEAAEATADRYLAGTRFAYLGAGAGAVFLIRAGLGDGWHRRDRAGAVAEATRILGTDLAYHSPILAPDVAAAFAARLVALVPGPVVSLSNVAGRAVLGPAVSAYSFTPLTRATFNEVLVIVGGGWAALLMADGED